MSLLDRLKGYSISLSGEAPEETKSGIAKAVCDYIDETEEKVITHSEVVDAICISGNVFGESQRKKLALRYLSGISNRDIDGEVIYSILAREAVVKFAKEGCFGELDLKQDEQINVREGKGAEFFTKAALWYKSEEMLRAYILRRVKKLLPTYNFMLSKRAC